MGRGIYWFSSTEGLVMQRGGAALGAEMMLLVGLHLGVGAGTVIPWLVA